MRDVAPHIPISPEEIIQSSIEAWRAGAAVVHITYGTRKQAGLPGSEPVPAVVEALRAKPILF